MDVVSAAEERQFVLRPGGALYRVNKVAVRARQPDRGIRASQALTRLANRFKRAVHLTLAASPDGTGNHVAVLRTFCHFSIVRCLSVEMGKPEGAFLWSMEN
jgi:hypothetical protein